jgi:poly-gamma-glutamate synthesis protein (capsule biosynthesis protein)
VAVIGATQVLDGNLIAAWTATATHPGLASAKRVDRLVAEVRRVRATSDVVVVFLHWGVETTTCPSAAQRDLARTLAAAGADIIVGGHAHRVQGGGYLGRAFVDYGLGNFGFPATSAEAAKTGVLTVTVEGGPGGGTRTGRVLSYRWDPGLIRDASPYPLIGPAADEARAAWDRLRSCTGLTAGPT